ncbi:MAG: hypothetical protein R6V44_15420 [Paracoccaceae bacterium]
MAFTIPEWVRPGAWGAVVGAVGGIALAFGTGWIVTSDAAATEANASSQRAVLAALTPFCVAEFGALTPANRETHLAALRNEQSWKQGDYVEAQGWATSPGADGPDRAVADACADMLLEAPEA